MIEDLNKKLGDPFVVVILIVYDKNMFRITARIQYQGVEYLQTWLPIPEFEINDENIKDITQVSGVLFDQEGKILICRSSSEGRWGIPGGHPENGETPEKTLIREVLEEVCLEVEGIELLGAVKISVPSDSSIKPYYQLRMYAKPNKFLPLKIDPATNKMFERVFVPFIDLPNYVSWGEVGDAVFQAGYKKATTALAGNFSVPFTK